MAVSDLSWKPVYWSLNFFATLHISMNGHKSPVSVDFGVTDEL